MKYQVSFDIEFKKNPNKGKLIVIEGIDGSGKTTQAKNVVEKLEEKNIDAVLTKEPTDLVIGKFIKENILSGKIDMPPIALQYLFNADRAMHLGEIDSLLKKGKTVIMDRYFWSSVAYALADIDGVTDYYLAAFSVLSFYNQFIVPDITIYLDLPIAEAVARIKKSHKHLEIYDHEHKLKKIQKGYEYLLKKFPEEFKIVNANQEEKKVTEEILEKISKSLK